MIAADDPRHGERAGYLAGCLEPCCADANRIYCKRYRNRKILAGGEVTTPAETLIPHLTKLRATMSLGAIAKAANTHSSHIHRLLTGETTRVTNAMAARILAVTPDTNVGTKWVNATGARRRLQSLCALGHSFGVIDRHLNYGRQNLWLVAHGQRHRISSTWDQRIRAVWEALAMELPNPTDRYERGSVTRTRATAAAKGWAPPLAWDDIDDLAEIPHGWQYAGEKALSRRELLAELDERHAGITAVCTALNVQRQSLERWAERNGMRDVYERMVAREQPKYVTNQHIERRTA